MELRSGCRLMPLENKGASCGPPQPKRRRQDPSEKVCRLCQRGDADPMVVGELCHQERLSVHENCLYHASGLTQRGADDEGFYGFLLPDIRQEIKRVATKRCCFWHQPGASVTCQGRLHRSSSSRHRRRCSRAFHFPCGREGECISQFFGQYKSFCSKHRPVQRLRRMRQHQTRCLCCWEPVSEQPCFDTLVCPACTTAWLHRHCVQTLALNSGLRLFRCPHC